MDYIEDRESHQKQGKKGIRTAILVKATVSPQPIPIACCQSSGIGAMTIEKNFEVRKNDPYKSMKI